VNATTPIADLHWSIAHVPTITQANVDAAKSLGVGLALHGFRNLTVVGGKVVYDALH